MYNMDIKRLKQFKGIDEKESLLDRMGKDEAAAHLSHNPNGRENYERRNSRPEALEQAAYIVGQMVRGTMQRISGTAPEHLAVSEPIKDVKNSRERTDD